MLVKLIINNFQSHRHTEIDFSKGVNVIVGQSDSGKSAIFRALNWVIHNRPTGDAFRSIWGGETFVTLILDNHTVTRLKSDSKNMYIVDSQEFTAFGTSVPEEVIKALNIGSINTQFQLDRPYLISETPGAVATHFNSIANFEQIDKSMVFVDKNIRAFNSKVKEINETIENKKEELNTYRNLDQAAELYTRAINTEQNFQNTKNTILQINKIFDQFETINSKIAKLSKFQLLDKPVTETLAFYRELKNKSGQLLKLRKLVDNFNNIESLLIKAAKITEYQTKVSDGLSQLVLINETKIKIKRIKKTINAYHHLSEVVTGLKKERDKSEQLFHDNFPNTCPLCGK